MPTLAIRHEPGGQGHRFSVQRVSAAGIKAAPSVEIADPLVRRLGQTQLTLGEELSWYLEHYLDYPFGPNEQRAQRVTEALRAWGTDAFTALFDAGQARDFYSTAVESGHTELHLVIASDEGTVLAWPWEALHDPLVGDLAQLCRIERQLDHLSDPPPLPENLSRERIGILLVTARPFEGDVAYRSISRPLVELIHQRGLPADVTVLRPPTLKQLRAELTANPGAYHLVHFDGHGAFSQAPAATASAHAFRGPRGHLVFEQDDGSADSVMGEQLSQLLREHRIPIAVLNACQSGMHSAAADDAFASVATFLLRAGVRSVVAMGYSLYVSAAREFLPAFYERLFDSGSIAEATRAGRQALLAQPKRLSARGPYPLQDWLVPVLYQQQPLVLDFAPPATTPAPGGAAIPADAQLNPREAPYGFIGRDSAVLALERALRRPPAGLLIHGLGGVGKTTLAHGFIEWLAQTDGLPGGVAWLSFVDIRTADYVINRLVEGLFGTDAIAAPDDQKLTSLVQRLRTHPMWIVWDNFESASGAAEAGLDASMPPHDRQALKAFLEQLRGGQTKVLITSRSDEAWLGPTACFRLPLGGLQGEERWELAEAMLTDLGIRVDRDDETLATLLNRLEGHPLMMRAILPKLATQQAGSLLAALDQYVPEADSPDPVEQRLYATLRVVEDGLPDALKPLLYPLGLHEGFVDANYLATMARGAQQPFDAAAITRTLQWLEAAGLTQGLGQNVFRLHPALSRYLRARAHQFVADDTGARAWQRAFVGVLAQLANEIAPKGLHDQRSFFAIFGGSVAQARRLAEQTAATAEYGALTQGLATYALNRRHLPLAQHFYEALARQAELHELEEHRAAAYHQLGRVAEERRDFAGAEAWYRKSLAIKERLDDERGAAATYHHLGRVAQARSNFAAAEAWYGKALAIAERLGDEPGAAATYHQLGRVAEARRDFAGAEAWYRQSLAIEERLGNEPGAAITYQQLGRVAEAQRDFAGAEAWYRQSLAIKERLDDEHGAATTYHQLGFLAQERSDFAGAEAWYRKSLAIKERLDDEYGASITYHQLGLLAHERSDFAAAEAWYGKSLAIKENLDDEPGAAFTYGALGLLNDQRGAPLAAVDCFLRALALFKSTHDEHNAGMAVGFIRRIHGSASPALQGQIDALCTQAGLGSFSAPMKGELK